jgi:hypothetical protein
VLLMGKKNPVLDKVRKEAYEIGLKNGIKIGEEIGEKKGVDKASQFFADKVDGLVKVPGIGPKLYQKFVEHFGKQYFREVDENERDKKNHK